MMKNIVTFLFLTIFLFPSNSYSLIEVDITRGNINPLPVAVSPLFSDKVSETELKKKLNLDKVGSMISNVVENNLKKLDYLILLMKMLFYKNQILLI